MIIWRGFGCLAIPIIAGCFFWVEVWFELISSHEFYRDHGWPKVVAGLVAAVAVWFIGSYLNSRPGRALIDKQTGEEVVIRPSHDLFFIPMQWWSFAAVAIGVFAAFQ